MSLLDISSLKIAFNSTVVIEMSELPTMHFTLPVSLWRDSDTSAVISFLYVSAAANFV